MPQVDGAIAAKRAGRLRDAGARALATHLDRNVGTRQAVLIETSSSGRTAQFAPVRFARPQEAGHIVAARLVGHDGREFTGALTA